MRRNTVSGKAKRYDIAGTEARSLPADLDASKVTTHGFGDGFKVSDVKVSGKTVSVTFSLSDPDAIKTYSDLEKIVDAAGDGDGLMKLTVPGVVINKDAEIGAHHTIVGTVDGSFGATAESEAGTHKVFSFTWKGVQLADGKDAVATDDEVIQPTVKPVKSAEPNPSNPTPHEADPLEPESHEVEHREADWLERFGQRAQAGWQARGGQDRRTWLQGRAEDRRCDPSDRSCRRDGAGRSNDPCAELSVPPVQTTHVEKIEGRSCRRYQTRRSSSRPELMSTRCATV